MKKKSSLLGDRSFVKKSFPHLPALLKEFEKKEFRALNDRSRSEKINRALLEFIQKAPEPCFLLSEVLDFVEQIDQRQLLSHYTFTSFELWLNQLSQLPFEENRYIRAKIAGKRLERSDYQPFFPIGMGKVYEGTHFVTAHKSPDLDTTVASFWGWVDAFAARVGDGLHVWNLPGGPPSSQIEIDWMFRDIFGAAVFTHLPKNRTALSLTGNDLMTQKGFLRKKLSDSIGSMDHERDHNAIVIVDDHGFYLGDWRNVDVEGVRQVILLLSSCFRWFENSLHLRLISLFAKVNLSFDEIEPLLQPLFSLKLKDCEPTKEFTSKQKSEVEDFLKVVLGIHQGLESTFEALSQQMSKWGGIPFEGLAATLAQMKKAHLFDSGGTLIEERPRIFSFLEKTIKALHEGIFNMRSRLERLDIALKIKYNVFGHHPNYVSVRSDVEEIRKKLGSYSSLTVIYPDLEHLDPVGVIQAADLRKNILGTVSLRDFCNRDEMGIPSYLEVISVIDHHKSVLNTNTSPLAIISDVQSCNTLVAQIAFQINDLYSLSGQNGAEIDSQIREYSAQDSASSNRLLQRLLKKKLIIQRKSPFFVDPDREFIEYLHFLYAILDDTDLLSKVSALDVECVLSLLNRLKSLSEKREVEVLSLDDLPRDKNFPKMAAMRILQCEDMYSLYRKVYLAREEEVEKNLSLCAHGKPSNIFADTKEQNECCRVGQTKVFVNNIPLFEKCADSIRRIWLKTAMEVHKEKPEINLHIHMISTIVSAEEVYQGAPQKYSHRDELWIWVPTEEVAIEQLKRFLNAFQDSPGLKNNPVEVQFLGSNAAELAMIFNESFKEIPQKTISKDLPIAVLKLRPGSLNSRKAMVTPYLPIRGV